MAPTTAKPEVLKWIIRTCTVFILLVSLFPHFMACLKLSGTLIPYYGILHRETVLECRFELEQDDSLYSLKWYKDGHEFFRYKPTDDPPIIVFPVVGVSVNENRSSLYRVHLNSISLHSKGDYKCEVSADAPSFQTLSEEKTMKVMVLPIKGPKIHGVLPWYNVGDNFTANCTARKSSPQAKLMWYINDAQIDAEVCDCITSETLDTGRTIDGTHFYNSYSRLQFNLESHYFRDGSLAIECKAIFRKTSFQLKDTVTTNIKTGLGGRQYAWSSTGRLQCSSRLMWGLWHLCLISALISMIFGHSHNVSQGQFSPFFYS